MGRVSAVFSSGGLVSLFGACVSSTGWWGGLVALSVRDVPELRQPPLRNRRTTFHAAPDDGSRTRDLSWPLACVVAPRRPLIAAPCRGTKVADTAACTELKRRPL